MLTAGLDLDRRDEFRRWIVDLYDHSRTARAVSTTDTSSAAAPTGTSNTPSPGSPASANQPPIANPPGSKNDAPARQPEAQRELLSESTTPRPSVAAKPRCTRPSRDPWAWARVHSRRRVEFEASERLRLVRVPDQQGAQQRHGQDVELDLLGRA